MAPSNFLAACRASLRFGCDGARERVNGRPQAAVPVSAEGRCQVVRLAGLVAQWKRIHRKLRGTVLDAADGARGGWDLACFSLAA